MVDEAECLIRIGTVYERAVELFSGDIPAAVQWFATPKKALGGDTPLARSKTIQGAQEVESMIGRIEHGVFF